MNNDEYKLSPVASPCFGPDRETNCKFNKPTIDRKYIKILALCLSYTPANLIYKGVKNPIQKQLRDMVRAGLLERYTKKGETSYFYRTTSKGQDLIIDALNA